MKAITLFGRRWFHRGPGNTYHTVEVFIDGERVHKSDRTYGYGGHYAQTGQEWLETNGFLPGLKHYQNGSTQPLQEYCRERGIVYNCSVADVSRKRDL